MAYRPKKHGRRFTDVRLEDIDYKNEKLLQRFLTDTGRILPRRQTGITALMQRRLTTAIKRARHLALLPYCEHNR